MESASYLRASRISRSAPKALGTLVSTRTLKSQGEDRISHARHPLSPIPDPESSSRSGSGSGSGIRMRIPEQGLGIGMAVSECPTQLSQAGSHSHNNV